jgi:hypothetical protein
VCVYLFDWPSYILGTIPGSAFVRTRDTLTHHVDDQLHAFRLLAEKTDREELLVYQ